MFSAHALYSWSCTRIFVAVGEQDIEVVAMLFADALEYFLKVSETSGVPEVLVIIDMQDWLQ